MDWEDKFPQCLLQSTATDDSDHCPLLLGLNDLRLGKRRFHFEAFWPTIEGFSEEVAAAWGSVPASPYPIEMIALKFRALTRALQSWSQKRFGHIKSQLLIVKKIIHQLEIAQDSRQLSNEEASLQCKLKKHSLALSSLLCTIAHLRSCIDRLRDGDANTTLSNCMQGSERERILFPSWSWTATS